ncbi:hypothetical protein [Streptomyces sp. NPDC097619]|uniref:hypothetical protein n=1 Tax=Streptomyces sp. NPDC097619 TaxID=3157228 RepID=UPI003323DDFA
MKQKILMLAGAAAIAGGVLIAVPATSQASTGDHGSVSTPAPQATVVFSDEQSVSDPNLVSPLGEFGTGRKNPRA